MMNIQAVIFDLDDTLMPEEPLVTRTFMDICTQAEEYCGVSAGALLETIRPLARKIWHQSPARDYCLSLGISSWEGLMAEFNGDGPELTILREWAPYYREKAWSSALEKCGINDPDTAVHLADLLKDTGYQHYRLYDDALNCLEELSGRYTLALLTNGLSDIQYGKINGAGIAGYFKEIVVSSELGFGKPDIRVFETMLAKLGVSPESALMVGNSLKNDIVGAQAAGIKAVHIDRDGDMGNTDTAPDYIITNLTELSILLK